jgi:phage-related protein
MAEEIESLIVQMKPEGLSETKEGLQGVEQTTEETAQSMEEQSEKADTFADKFQGAMSVAVAALAVGAGGLLSMVPVLGEALSGVIALVESIALKMDQVLRPVITPITNLLFRMAGAVNEMEGPLGKVVGILSAMAIVLATALLGPISATVAGIGALATGIILALEQLGLLKPLVKSIIGVFIGLRDIFKGVANFITSTLVPALKNPKDTIDGIINFISGGVSGTLQ